MNAIPNFATKADALRAAVNEALLEQRQPIMNSHKADGLEFDGAGVQRHHIKRLVMLLECSDALDVLAAILNGENA